MNASTRAPASATHFLRRLMSLSYWKDRSDEQLGLGGDGAKLIFLSSEGKVIATSIAIAATFHSRRVGLVDRDWLHCEEGLLLTPGGSIHTGCMSFAIDALFLDGRMRVLKCVRDLRPWRIALAPLRTKYVLELQAGRIAATEIEVGTRLFWLECSSGQELS
jgi:uncharacterized protein